MFKNDSIKIITTVTTRRPTLIRVWRTDGTQLTSSWILTPNTNLNDEGGQCSLFNFLAASKTCQAPSCPKNPPNQHEHWRFIFPKPGTITPPNQLKFN